MVLLQNIEMGIEQMQNLGTIQGFTPQLYLKLIQTEEIKVFENQNFTSLLKQLLFGRVDGAYASVAISNNNYDKLDKKLKSKGELVFDPNLPHIKSSYSMSTVKYPEIIEQFNEFLVNEKTILNNLKRKFKVDE